MKRSERLGVVIELAQKEEEVAASQFAQARNQHDSETARLKELDNYYHDYETRYAQKTTGLRAEDLVASRRFLGQLADVCQQQKHSILHAENVMEMAKKKWLECHLKYENLLSLQKRFQVEEYNGEQKKEQLEVDDWVTQSFSRKPSSY